MNLKQQAANRALDYVRSGMRIGLGSGSTTAHFASLLGARLHQGILQDVRVVPTSLKAAQQAQNLHIPLTTITDEGELDLAVDGADEVDRDLNLIKGLGMALLREKIVELHARQFVVIVDESKLVARLGRGALPVEIVPFEAQVTVRWLNTLGCRAELWRDESGQPYRTDNGNFLARCWFESDRPEGWGIPDIYALARALAGRPGVVEHGLFLDMASLVIVAGAQGIRILEREG